MKTRFKQTAVLALVLASPVLVLRAAEAVPSREDTSKEETSKEGTITDEVLKENSRAYSTYLEKISILIAERQKANASTLSGDLIDQVATAVYKDIVDQPFSDSEKSRLVATAADQTATAISAETKERLDGRTGDTSTGDSRWWPDDGKWPSTGKAGLISPGGSGTVGTYGTDGSLAITDHFWMIDLGGSRVGTDLVFAAGSMAINGSHISFNQLGALTEDSYTFATVAQGQGSGRFYNVHNLPDGYEIVYGESTISLSKISISAPEVGAVLPLMMMLMPWTLLRQRRS